ncbi:phosphate ABC transporter substrate-binding protein PstS [Rhodococcus sp. X156]|uniref:phosphate ABC transporter substrate-binding protein PstS n=1 Tax=Rhodococcus sp. X156 TaxID=2499145 RepID=UPI000FDB2D15|nr:phosphate ABC transporter substrate-binding protein PstS [Rhodococcus sp. X156]
MKLNRRAARSSVAIGFVAAGAVLLSACGTDDNTSSSSAAGSASTDTVQCGGTATLKASGSTAQANAMKRFITAYQDACSGKSLDYNGNGSGAGITEFLGKQTDFAGSDSPLSESKGEVAKAAERCGGAEAWNLPVVFGPIALSYNLSGVANVALDGPTVAKMFNGAITTWNDPAIAALNPGVSLPSTKVTVIFRNDESGTTDNFQMYLEKASDGAWTQGVGKAFKGGVGEGAKGNDGTAAAVKSTPGAITYNEWAFAKAQNLQTAAVQTSAGGGAVQISTESVGKTIAGATVKGQGNNLVLDTSSFYKPTQQGAYPIVLATYEIVCSKYPDAQTGEAVRAFLQTAITTGQRGLENNGYIPVPDSFKNKLSTAVDAIA